MLFQNQNNEVTKKIKKMYREKQRIKMEPDRGKKKEGKCVSTIHQPAHRSVSLLNQNTILPVYHYLLLTDETIPRHRSGANFTTQ